MGHRITYALAVIICLVVLPQAATGQESGVMLWKFTESPEDAVGVCKDYWGMDQGKKQQVLALYQEYQSRFADSLKSIWSAQVALEFAMIENPQERDKVLGLADQLNGNRAKLLRDRVEFRSRMAELTGVYIPLATDFVECLGVLRHGDGMRYPDEGSLPSDSGPASPPEQGGMGGSSGQGGQGGAIVPGIPGGPSGRGNDQGVEKF